MVLLVNEAQLKGCLVCLEIVLILMQDRSMVSVEHTIGSEIILDAPNGTPMSHGSCGISLQFVWRQCCVGAR
jgi:hypothetical protein